MVNKGVYPCPLCGRWRNRRGVPFEDASRTMAHITGAHDDAHRDERGEEYMAQIELKKVDDAEEPATNRTARDGATERVEVPWSDEPVPVDVAVEQLAETLDSLPEGLDTALEMSIGADAHVDELRDDVEELREEIDLLRSDVAALYRTVGREDARHGYVLPDEGSGKVWVPESVDP